MDGRICKEKRVAFRVVLLTAGYPSASGDPRWQCPIGPYQNMEPMGDRDHPKVRIQGKYGPQAPA